MCLVALHAKHTHPLILSTAPPLIQPHPQSRADGFGEPNHNLQDLPGLQRSQQVPPPQRRGDPRRIPRTRRTARKSFIKFRNSAVLVERICRGIQVRALVAKWHASACRIQRMNTTVIRRPKWIQQIVGIQRAARRFVRHAAATKIQAIIRDQLATRPERQRAPLWAARQKMKLPNATLNLMGSNARSRARYRSARIESFH